MIARALDLALAAYQRTLRPWLGARCRFAPSCSDYARQALAAHGLARGGGLALRRLLRCQPLHPGGYDPIPLPYAPVLHG